MPHTSFLCPDPAQWSLDPATGELDRRVPIPDCLACSLSRVDRACSWDYADLMLRIHRPIRPSFTPSAMAGCLRERYLKMNHDYAVDPANEAPRVRGISSHAGLETDHADILSEVTVGRRLLVDDRPEMVVLRPDKVYPKLGLVHDDKTRAYLRSVQKQPQAPEITFDHRFQLSVAAWAWQAPAFAEFPDGRVDYPEPILITSGQIIFRDGSKQVRVLVDLLPTEVVESHLQRMIRLLRLVYSGQWEPPPLPEDQRSRCLSCSVLDLCGIPKPKRAMSKRKKSNGAS